ncbi:2-dehydro-3-deoxygalactonokinase [Chitinimonas koreensis]|uniref:2-dehydro-3-deoxygalactonokinase n=1 Tax=Chitinimonas koreensis TaxID=356302 RepID=UPI000402B975|nr:2-dehydro-3-deoxygalactonokinase [Chitinimonas koreensis]QNM97660.1 2-dehydro-3-deoxygalactonokinase [Chitinimonas koreensis]
MQVIGIDWGSSNRRAYRVARDGTLLEKREDGQGVLTAAQQDFAASLHGWIGDWLAAGPAEVWLSGMIGSRSGWREAPYLPAPAALDALAAAALPLGDGQRIVPGICQRPPQGPADVMRGEETQLLGAWRQARRDGWYLLPGTHSKWVQLEGGRVLRFRSFMTGELYAQLRAHGALAACAQGPDDHDAAFDAGLLQGMEEPILSALFSIRAGLLLDVWPAAEGASRLSGLLIGAEWAAARRLGALGAGPLHLVGSPALAARHRRAADALGIETVVLDPDSCYRHALAALAHDHAR